MDRVMTMPDKQEKARHISPGANPAERAPGRRGRCLHGRAAVRAPGRQSRRAECRLGAGPPTVLWRARGHAAGPGRGPRPPAPASRQTGRGRVPVAFFGAGILLAVGGSIIAFSPPIGILAVLVVGHALFGSGLACLGYALWHGARAAAGGHSNDGSDDLRKLATGNKCVEGVPALSRPGTPPRRLAAFCSLRPGC